MPVEKLSAKEYTLIGESFLFRGIDRDSVRRILADERCECVRYDRGETLYSADSWRCCVGIVLSGTAQVRDALSEDGRFLMNTLSAGSLFGAAALFGSETGPYVTHITAKTACRVLYVPQIVLNEAMQVNYAIAENYIRFLSDRIRFLNQKIQGLVGESAVQMLARYLVRNAVEQDGHILVELPVSMSGLADMLNIGRASLYRAMDALEADGKIQRAGRKIQILDISALGNL